MHLIIYLHGGCTDPLCEWISSLLAAELRERSILELISLDNFTSMDFSTATITPTVFNYLCQATHTRALGMAAGWDSQAQPPSNTSFKTKICNINQSQTFHFTQRQFHTLIHLCSAEGNIHHTCLTGERVGGFWGFCRKVDKKLWLTSFLFVPNRCKGQVI